MQYLILFYEYFKIGLFTIGGGYAMLPMVQQVVLDHGWISYNELVGFIGIAESTPGPFAINLATFVGMEVGKATSLGVFGGVLGSLVATTAVILPSLIIIIAVTRVIEKFKTNKYVQGALVGIKPVVAGLILSALISISLLVIMPSLKLNDLGNSSLDKFNYVSLILFAIFMVVGNVKFGKKKINPILLIVCSAIIGMLLFGVFKLHL